METYVRFDETLAQVAEHFGLVFTKEATGLFDSAKVKYRGWRGNPEFKPLGHVTIETMSLSDLLDRSKKIFNLFQRWQKAPLLQIAVSLGLKKADISGFASLRLAATICKLAQLAVDSGLDLIEDKDALATQ